MSKKEWLVKTVGRAVFLLPKNDISKYTFSMHAFNEFKEHVVCFVDHNFRGNTPIESYFKHDQIEDLKLELIECCGMIGVEYSEEAFNEYIAKCSQPTEDEK